MTKTEYLSRKPANEDALTADTHRFINNNYPQLRGFYLHIPNESATNVIIRMKLVAMGLLPGAPDFLFLKPYTWFLELKTERGSLSPKQRQLHEKWKQEGIIVETAYSKEEVAAIIEKHLHP
jgi:hypothetical protein